MIDNTSEIKVKHGNQYPEKQKRLYQAMEDIKNFFSISLFDNDEEKHNDTFLFPKKFDNDICSLLYDLLKEKKLICKNTEYSDFQYWFRCNNKENPKPIVWTGTKQLARELLEYLYKKPNTIFADIERIVPNCFTYKGGPMKLSKRKKTYSFESDAIKKFFSDHEIK